MNALFDPIRDKGWSMVGTWLGSKSSKIVYKYAGKAFGLYGLYDFGNTFYKTMGQCMDVERGGKDYSWSRSGE